jgi:crossover junction endodeoxyribonuclease RusA
MKTLATYTLVVPGRPISSNKRMHFQAWAKETAKWREATAAAATAAGLSPLPRIKVTACPWLRGKRKQDVGACMRAVKACVDGLVDAGVIPDDTDEYVVKLSFLPPALQAEVDELVLTIEEAR